MTTCALPSNACELQLYRVLERANLLAYFSTFISQGGDDVQQFCEAGEEEFLEIMALVGMASKPLHVRRLQKALQEWVQNPGSFQQSFAAASLPAAPGSIIASVQRSLGYAPSATPPDPAVNKAGSPLPPAPLPEGDGDDVGDGDVSPGDSPAASDDTPSMSFTLEDKLVMTVNTNGNCGGASPPPARKSPLSPACTPGGDTDPPQLSESQMWAIESAAARLITDLPPYEAKSTNMKRHVSKEIQEVMDMADEDAMKIVMLRKYAAIYGRFDSKRKNEKRMSLHEVSVNEAAAQICKHVPTLLTRRNDLFPLARQVVRHSGYQYSKGHSRAQPLDFTPSKRPRLEATQGRALKPDKLLKAEMDNMQRECRLADISRLLSELSEKQSELKSLIGVATESNTAALPQLHTEYETLAVQQRALVTEQAEIVRRQSRSQLRYPSVKTCSISPRGSVHSADDMDEDSVSGSTEGLSPSGGSPRGGRTPPRGRSPPHDDTLFAEGLRIAHQYGMSDFAAHLKGLRSYGDDNEADEIGPPGVVKVDGTATAMRVCVADGTADLGEQAAWDREVEHDRRRLVVPPAGTVPSATVSVATSVIKSEPTDYSWENVAPLTG